MNKYSKKIKTLIDHNFYKESEINYDEHEIIQLIKNTFQTVYLLEQQYHLIKSINILKSNDYSNHPLIYSAIVDLYNSKLIEFDIDPNNFNVFVDWFRKKIKTINLKKIFKNTKYYDIFFNPIHEKKILFDILYSNIFISLDSIHHIECEDLIYEHYGFDNINVHIYNLKNDHFKINIDLIFKIINFFRLFFKSKKHLDIYCILGKQKKYISNSEYLCSDNINSGLCAYDKYIMIWRKEEFYKVLIHELCHYYHVDYHVDDKIYNHFKHIINIKCELFTDSVNESFNESIALIIHSSIYSVIHNLSFTYIFNYEMLFTKFQISKIINHMKMEYLSDILIKPVKQTTSVISYYIVKYLFIINMPILLDYLKDNGFVAENKNKFVELYKNILTEKNIKSVDLSLQIKLLDKPNNKFIYKTLCMAMFQL